MQRWLHVGLDLLFPPRCAGCGKVDNWWCEVCQQAVDQIPWPPQQRPDPALGLEALAATGKHEGRLQQGIWALKFENAPRLAVPLGQRLGTRLQQLDWMIDIIIPVPLHMNRLQKRGYNQATLLARQVAQMHMLPLFPQAIHRQVETRSQVGLNAEERRTNMQDAFRADPQLIANQNILLIDDVFTTGATIGACAQAAREAGAAAVFGLTVTMA